jgi:hypothetical protein
MVHVSNIARQPHPVGSAEHSRVRDYIYGELSKLGLAPQIETGIGSYSRGRYRASGPVENIVARLSGSADSRPLMLAAHYDSVRTGPGASDDAHGVAVLLEVLRALRSGPQLRNDVIFLITDGEEGGLLGADAFTHSHPRRYDPALVLNFEARGTSGSSYMFETSTGNAWLLDELQTVAPRVQATSVAYEIYRRMPNDTDLTLFKRAGMAGMNFAFIGHPEYYHSPQDDVEHLDRRALQENGNYGLGLARVFGQMDLRVVHSGDAVYFPTRLTSLIVYPVSWAVPIAWITVIVYIGVAWMGRLRRYEWFMIAPCALVMVLLFLLVNSAPGASYLVEWPLLAGFVSLGVLATAQKSVAPGWRLAVLMICPGAVFLLVVPFASTLVVALGWSGAAPVLAVSILLIAICLFPQAEALLRRRAV